jgi:SAM-dependent methyltransferase
MGPAPLDPAPTSLDEVRERFGDWTAMSIHLGDGLYTMRPDAPDARLRRFVQVVADVAGKPLDRLRFLDLACLEGQYAIEFGLHGAAVVGIEGREANYQRAEFTRRSLALDNVEFHLDDVRNLAEDRYGRFDVVLCAGILYHLDAPDVFDFAQRIHDVCDGVAIFETFVSLRDTETFEHRGRTYNGLHYEEHPEGSSASFRARNYWASIDNERSVWLTHASLCNLLRDVGFTSVFQCHTPTLVDGALDRVTYVAIKCRPTDVRSSPVTDASAQEPTPERPERGMHPVQQERGKLFRLLKNGLPQQVKDLVKPILRAARVIPPDATPEWRHRQAEEERRSNDPR